MRGSTPLLTVIQSDKPALVLAPMDGITDAPMRALQGELGGFTYAVTEFIRVSVHALPTKVFRRDVPELSNGSRTISGLPVQVQILGGHPGLMAESAVNAVDAGANSIDINFGCPAPTVNRSDGGASLLKEPSRIREVVSAVRQALPSAIPVSAKLRLGWECQDDIHVNAAMAAEGGANWITIHARTRTQGYRPPVFWPQIEAVRRRVGIPVVANGDIWNIDDFRRCLNETDCIHFMIGRGALANPHLPHQIAAALGLPPGPSWDGLWSPLFERLIEHSSTGSFGPPVRSLHRIKQWAKLAHTYGELPWFDEIKAVESLPHLLSILRSLEILSLSSARA